MIKDYSGKKCTPKQLAARIIKNKLHSASYWTEQEDTRELSEHEIKLIDKQVASYINRFEKILDKIIYKNTKVLK